NKKIKPDNFDGYNNLVCYRLESHSAEMDAPPAKAALAVRQQRRTLIDPLFARDGRQGSLFIMYK
ncbi:MAG: hypothetical protein DRP46_10215, partial [Candidatus Zixiibacteriota bacterium]